MTVSGGIKFFRKSWCDIDFDDASVTPSSGDDYGDYIRNRNNTDRWISVGSNDATTETLEVNFGTTRTIDRLLLVRHNWKGFTVQYWNGSAWTDFSSVVTAEGSQATITETTNAKTTSYYEFASVSTTKILISVTTTQTVNAEKYVYQVLATQELGTFTGFPQWTPTFTRAQVRNESVRGKPKFSILDEVFSLDLRFDGYPTAADHILVQTLWDGQEEFLVYPCGGKSSQFRFTTMIGNRLQDIYLVWFDGPWSPAYAEGVYALPVSYSLNLVEVA